MAQETLFKTAEQIREEKVEKLMQRGLNIWRNNEAEYKGLLKKYQQLLNDKKKRGIKPLAKLKKAVIDTYPVIPFLDLMTEAEALKMLENWASRSILAGQLDLVEDTLKTSVSINSIKSWNTDYLYSISRMEYRKKKREAIRNYKPSTAVDYL